MTMYLVLPAFISSPIPLLETATAFVFFIVCILQPNLLTSSARSPIILTKKLTYFFLIYVQLEALTPVRDK